MLEVWLQALTLKGRKFMKKVMTILLTLGIMLGLSAVLWAQPETTRVRTPRIHRRAVGQHKRIQQGVRSGEITKGERGVLGAEQKDIHQDVKEARADGVVTRNERKEIKHDQNKANRDIYRLKHNRRTRR